MSRCALGRVNSERSQLLRYEDARSLGAAAAEGPRGAREPAHVAFITISKMQSVLPSHGGLMRRDIFLRYTARRFEASVGGYSTRLKGVEGTE